jgi:hypothetical protein
VSAFFSLPPTLFAQPLEQTSHNKVVPTINHMMTTNKQSKRGRHGRTSRQPLGFVSANTPTKQQSSSKTATTHKLTVDSDFLPPKYIASATSNNANQKQHDCGDESSISSYASTASIFSYRGMKQTISLKKGKRGLLSKFGRKARGEKRSSTVVNELLDENASCDAMFTYTDFDMLTGKRIVNGTSVSNVNDEMKLVKEVDNLSSVKSDTKEQPPGLEVINPDGHAVHSPHVICDLPRSLISPTWSEYGSGMLKNWQLLEKAASLIASPSTTPPTPPSSPMSNVAANLTEDTVWKPTQFHPIEGEQNCSRPCSPLGDFVDVEQGNLPCLYPVPNYSDTAISSPSVPTPLNESNMPRQRKAMLDNHDCDIETGKTTQYMVMDGIVTSSNLMQCFAPLTHHVVKGKVPAIIAMTFGITVFLLHIIWVLNH